jgi:hypothetical protein
LSEWREVVLRTATPRPEGQYEDGAVCDAIRGRVLFSSTPIKWKDVPGSYPEYLHIGYGAVDNAAYTKAAAVLRGDTQIPDRTRTDNFFALDATAREAIHEAYSIDALQDNVDRSIK